jgi:hypothetical protein
MPNNGEKREMKRRQRIDDGNQMLDGDSTLMLKSSAVE